MNDLFATAWTSSLATGQVGQPQGFENISQIQNKRNTERIGKTCELSATLKKVAGQEVPLNHSNCRQQVASPEEEAPKNLTKSMHKTDCSPAGFLERTKEWNQKRQDKLQAQVQKKKEAEEQNMMQTTMQFKSNTISRLVESKVAIFLERNQGRLGHTVDRKKLILAGTHEIGESRPIYQQQKTIFESEVAADLKPDPTKRVKGTVQNRTVSRHAYH
jgi:hypothetical protein